MTRKDTATGEQGLESWFNEQPHFAQQDSILKEYIETKHPELSTSSGIKQGNGQAMAA